MREFYSNDLFKQWETSPTLEYGQSKEPQVFENAVITPYGCYDSDGNLIEISQHKRGRQTEPGSFPIESYPKKLNGRPSVEVESAYYINYANSGHWGHFLTETFARIQHLDSDPMKVYVNGNLGSITQAYSQHTYKNCRGSICVGRLILPIPTMVNCYSIFPEHIDTCRKMGDFYGRKEIKTERLYLSRTHLTRSNRWTEGEIELEQKLSDAGWTIVHMHELPIDQQIGLLENATYLVGCIGSAFHNLMMTRKNPGKVIYLTCNEFDTNPNYALHDAILGNDSVYLDCQDVVNKGNRTKKIRNPQDVFEYLEKI
jgi:hypothetical protein